MSESLKQQPDKLQLVRQQFVANRWYLAERVVSRQYARRVELVERYGPTGRTRCVDDTCYHLLTLGAAVGFDSFELFRAYIEWAGLLMTSRGVDLQDCIENLECMREVLIEELPPELARSATTLLNQACQQLRQPLPAGSRQSGQSAGLSGLAQSYLEALLRHDRAAAARLLGEATNQGTEVKQLYLEVFAPAQREVGQLWLRGDVTVAQEHYCSATTQFFMSQLFPRFLRAHDHAHTLIAASVGNELHEIGLRMVADVFEMEGWNTIYLGANLPASSVVRAVADSNADVVALATTMNYHLLDLAGLVGSLRADERTADVKILVGGYPFAIDSQLWQKVGADAMAADAEDAVRMAEKLVCGLQPKHRSTGAGGTLRSELSQTPDAVNWSATNDDVTSLNNELITVQRELTKSNLQLRSANEQIDAKIRELEEVDRQRNQFLATLAHELRGPLSACSYGLALWKALQSDSATASEAQLALQRQLAHMTRLVDDLSDLSRAVYGKIALDKSPVALHEIVHSAVSIVRPKIDELHHTLNVRLPNDAVCAEVDSVRMTQVIANLLTNAAKFTDAGGSIDVELAREFDTAVISVADNGQGITGDMLERIFDTFVQGPPEPGTKRRDGLGIGLSLVRHVVQLHGGQVEVESAGQGLGSRFRIRLPALNPASRDIPQQCR